MAPTLWRRDAAGRAPWDGVPKNWGWDDLPADDAEGRDIAAIKAAEASVWVRSLASCQCWQQMYAIIVVDPILSHSQGIVFF